MAHAEIVRDYCSLLSWLFTPTGSFEVGSNAALGHYRGVAVPSSRGFTLSVKFYSQLACTNSRIQFHQLPREMQDRMPSPYVKLLKLPLHSSLSGDELYRVTMDLTLSYCRNYDLVFPELNFMPMLVQYTQLLSLPSMSSRLTTSGTRLTGVHS